MKYKWLDVGDQDKCIRKVCFLGLWQLEIKEAGWKNDKLYVWCRAYVWSDEAEDYIPFSMPNNKTRQYKNYGKGCQRHMQDWYAEHVLMPKLMMGTDDGQVSAT